MSGIAILDTLRMEVIIAVGHGMFDVVTSRQGLDSKNVIQMEAFIATDGLSCIVNGTRQKKEWKQEMIVSAR